MAKTFKIYFSKSEEIVKETYNEEKGEETLSIKEYEIKLLTILFRLAARDQKTIDDSIECKDCISQLENIDKEEFVEFTKKDLGYCVQGWEVTKGSRPYSWIDTGGSMMKQISKPFEIDVVWNDKLNKFCEA
ncbi:MAG: hypothetical protein KAI70_00615 [Candidatus Omnitrophica bacterium]|nr:hypothetical protein [Candidatus Omnitrophota bacterium]